MKPNEAVSYIWFKQRNQTIVYVRLGVTKIKFIRGNTAWWNSCKKIMGHLIRLIVVYGAYLDYGDLYHVRCKITNTSD